MSARLINLFWLVVLLAGALVAGGWLAEKLIHLEDRNTDYWQSQLQEASKEQSSVINKWLVDQINISKEIAKDDRIYNFLKKANDSGMLPPKAEAVRAIHEYAKLKYGLNHTYLFSKDGRLLLFQENARELPLKIRKTLAAAYQTNLDRYSFISLVDHKKWLFVSSRVKQDNKNLGYVVYMIEVSAAANILKDSSFRWRYVDFNLARRNGDDGVFIINWGENKTSAFLYKLSQIEIPLFNGKAEEFGLYKLPNGQERFMFTSIIPEFPFWQHVGSVQLDVAYEQVNKTRNFYLLSAAVVLLFLLTLVARIMGRIINPVAPLFPSYITKITGNKTKHTPAPQKQPQSMKPQELFKKIRVAFTGSKSRTLSEEEKELIKKRNQPPQQEPATKTKPAAKVEPVQIAKEEPAVATKVEEPIIAQTEEEKAEAAEREQIKQIHRCIENERFRLYFQSILETKNKKKVMFETLLRLVSDNGDLMQPNEFIPLAFKHNFIDQIDDMVIIASLRRHMEILSQGKDIMLSINLSYGAFSSVNFKNTFKEGLDSGKIRPDLINFELSSKEIIEDDAAMGFVRDMQAKGARFSVDYFGNNKQTVEAAKKLKFNYMKINALRFDGLDRGLPEQIEKFQEIILAGQENSLPMIVEKIENKAVLDLCEKLKVPYVQGFYLDEPSPKLTLGW